MEVPDPDLPVLCCATCSANFTRSGAFCLSSNVSLINDIVLSRLRRLVLGEVIVVPRDA